ncbi:hypothetical protein OH491_24250 [Termitidicoccus mucosus]
MDSHAAVPAAGRKLELPPRLSGRPLAGAALEEEVLPAAPDGMLLGLARAVETARMNLHFAGVTPGLPVSASPVARERFCWEVVAMNNHKQARELALPPVARRLLTDVFLDCLGATGSLSSLSRVSQARLNALTGTDLVRGVAVLRPDLPEELARRAAALGLEYPRNPFGLPEDYAGLAHRDAAMVPEVAALLADETMAGEPRADGRRLVVDALRMHPCTREWMMEALAVLGRHAKSAFVPGGLASAGYSVLFTVLRKREELWREAGAAVAAARRHSVHYGGRKDPDFFAGDRLPWRLVGALYARWTDARPDEAHDAFKAYAPYREVFYAVERRNSHVASPEVFYRNVGVLFLRMQRPVREAGPDLFEELVSPGFAADFETHREKLMHVVLHLSHAWAGPAGKDGASFALSSLLMARTDEERLTALGRVLSTPPLSSQLFDPGHPLYLGDAVSAVSKAWFSPAPEEIIVADPVKFTRRDARDLRRLCGVFQVFRDLKLSVPYGMVTCLRDFADSAAGDGLTLRNASLRAFLQACPPRGVEAYSPVSLLARYLQPYLDGDRWGADSGSSAEKMTVEMRRVLKLLMSGYWVEVSSTAPGVVSEFYQGLDACGSLAELLDYASNPGILARAGYEGKGSRELFNRLLQNFDGVPLGESEAAFGYTPSEWEDLAALVKSPAGLLFLPRFAEPSPLRIIEACASFERGGLVSPADWQERFDRLVCQVRTHPLTVCLGPEDAGGDASGVPVVINAALLSGGGLDGWRRVWEHARDARASPEAGASFPEPSAPGDILRKSLKISWREPVEWPRALNDLNCFEWELRRRAGLEDFSEVAPFLRLVAVCHPRHAKFFESGAALADLFKDSVVPADEAPGVLHNLENDMRRVLGASAERGLPVPEEVSMVEPVAAVVPEGAPVVDPGEEPVVPRGME